MKKWIYFVIISAALISAIGALPKNFTGVIGPVEKMNMQNVQSVTLSSGWPILLFMTLVIGAFLILNLKKKKKSHWISVNACSSG